MEKVNQSIVYDIANIRQKVFYLQQVLDNCKNSEFFVELQQKKQELSEKLNGVDFFKDKKKSQTVYSELKNIDTLLDKYSELQRKVGDCQELLDCVVSDDLDMLADIDSDIKITTAMVEEFRINTYMRGEYDYNNAIIEINAGAGGQDAQEWVSILYRMYKAYSGHLGLVVRELDSNTTDGGGYKSVSFVLVGTLAYGYLKAEKGIHRLVRISPFDSQQRRHTSFASVEVMPEIVNDGKIVIKPDDIKIDTFRSGGAGGQHVNKTDSAVRITHISTGIVVSCQNERSQIQNKETAMSMLMSKLVERNEREFVEKNKTIKGELKKIEWGSQIRSYVFAPYKLVKDHRTGFENSDVQAVVDGDLDGFVMDYLKKSMGGVG